MIELLYLYGMALSTAENKGVSPFVKISEQAFTAFFRVKFSFPFFPFLLRICPLFGAVSPNNPLRPFAPHYSAFICSCSSLSCARHLRWRVSFAFTSGGAPKYAYSGLNWPISQKNLQKFAYIRKKHYLCRRKGF